MTEEKKKRPFVDARPVLDKLAHFHPQLFGARFLPLKLGIFEELMATHPDEFTKEELKAALAFHARSTRYLEAVASGEQRHGLNGEPAGEIAPEHVHHAIVEVFRRRQQRSKQDLKPWVVARLAAAIEASRLDRDAYFERVNAKDDDAIALLDDAFAEIGARKAKREALRRAFQASGKDADEFARMYGLQLSDVEEAIAQP
jgi:sRNA-binding protein